MKKSGIDINVYSSHSIKCASASKANMNAVPIEKIMNVDGIIPLLIIGRNHPYYSQYSENL